MHHLLDEGGIVIKEKLKVYEAFAGKGTFSSAMKELNIPIEIVGYCEIDEYASTAFSVIHNIDEDLNDWDITTIKPESLPDFDIFTHGSPCTNFSLAGRQEGGDKNSGTASSLMWYSVDIISVKKPKYVLWENVAAVLQPKHKHNFDDYIKLLDELGYNSYWKLLNSKDFGIPQNRNRIYVVSIRRDIDDKLFKFPTGCIDQPIHLNDVLEDDVEPPIYSNIYGGFGETKARVHNDYSPTIRTAKGGGHIPSVKKKYIVDDTYANREPRIYENYSPSIRANRNGLKVVLESEVDEKYFVSDFVQDRLQITDPTFTKNIVGTTAPEFRTIGQRDLVYSTNGIMGTLVATDYKQPKQILVDGDKVRKLTPLECFRLMDETDENFYKVKNALIEKFYKGKDRADSQLYKIAGNSIVKRVLIEYFKVLFKDYIS